MKVVTDAALTLSATAELAGVRPVRLAAGDSFELTADLPDGGVRRLIWIRNWRPAWERTYYFRNPIKLPEHSRIALYSGKSAEAAVLLAR